MTGYARRVVITGMGLVSPLGNSPGDLWNALSTGRSGVGNIEGMPVEHLGTQIGGQARRFSGLIEEFGPLDKTMQRAIKKGLKLMCREIQMGVASAQLALVDCGLNREQLDPDRIGTMFGSDYIMTLPDEFTAGIKNCLDEGREFHFERWAESGLPEVEPLWLLKYLPNMPASHVAIFNDCRGPSNSLTVREASSNLSVAEAATTIARGAADVMIAGATGSRIHPLRTIHISLQEQLAESNGDPAAASRPFDRDRNGMVIGEGAGTLIVESLEYAQARGATILGEVIGHASCSASTQNGVADYERSFAHCIAAALESSRLRPEQIGHVHAHGLSTRTCDRAEARAIHAAFGDQTPVTTAKSYMGNLGAGSGMIELIASLLAIRENRLFPILNLDHLDPDCPIHGLQEPAEAGRCFLNMNITPQGQASGLVIRAFDG
jgi:3-oxoacyl-[acyl-carrier-protein] synthase II